MNHTVTGLTGAAPIWHDVMDYLHQGKPNRNSRVPTALLSARCARSTDYYPTAFARQYQDLPDGTVPTQQSTIVQKFPIHKETNKIAVAAPHPTRSRNASFSLSAAGPGLV